MKNVTPGRENAEKLPENGNPDAGAVKEIIKNDAALVGEELRRLLGKGDDDVRAIYDAMAYSLDGGGKRVRPCLVLEFCRALSGREEDQRDALRFACALEMIHTYSLIHDDLPCMDDDDLRRGKPTNHKVFGEATAVLAGDALLTLAFGVVSDAVYEYGLAPGKAIKAVKILADAAGSAGMIGGQMLDIRGETEKLSPSLHKKMNLLKTGALIRAAVLLGCLAAGAEPDVTGKCGSDIRETRACEKTDGAGTTVVDAETTLVGAETTLVGAEVYALNVGLAFQVRDDLLDMAEKGKEEEKTTFLSFMTPGEAEEYIKELTDDAVKAVASHDREGVLAGLARLLAGRKV